ncbi:MAG: type II secretion system protein [Candidatus Edwardsbacteria bacterium]|nr:type II secretion system protein [Candidatus Edwardsbacteria bacterium]
MRSQNGFSLIELVIAIFICMLLSAVGYSQYVTAWENARQSATKANMHTAQLCAEDFSTRAEGVYPGGINTMIYQAMGYGSDSTVIAGANKPPYASKALIPSTFVNPIDSTHDAVRTGIARKPAGCVYYCGVDGSGKPVGEGKPAVGYKVTGMGPYRLLTLVLTSGVKKETGNDKK